MPQMTLREFAGLVGRMRQAQKAYFASNKSSTALAESKALEAHVDRLIREIREGQGGLLFGEAEDGGR
jgi:hypothetical protein